MKIVILTGNPGEGFAVIGPFDFMEDVTRYMEIELAGEESWALPLNPPEEATS